jgi:ABC-2 type transport system ATP-binding protein
MISVENLNKYYGEVPAVQDLSFNMERGEILGFLGPNGAGKTTTMKILTGYLPATSGNVSVCGFDVFDKPLDVKRRIGYLPEHPPLYNDMRVDAYLRFVAKIKDVGASARKGEIDGVIERCSLVDVRKRLIGQLSKGYKQRVGLAQALLGNPEVLILDEPTIGLDPRQIKEIRELIKGLAEDEKHTIILSSHILQEVAMICERVLIISEGKKVVDKDLKTLMAEMSLEEAFLEATATD